MRTRITSLAIAALATLAGCALAPPPKPEDIRPQAMPNVATPGQWSAQGVAAGAVSSSWLAAFDDAQLQALVKEALAYNPDLRVAATRVEVASEYVNLADSTLYPQVNLLARGGGEMVEQGLGCGEVRRVDRGRQQVVEEVPLASGRKDELLAGRLAAGGRHAAAGTVATAAATAAAAARQDDDQGGERQRRERPGEAGQGHARAPVRDPSTTGASRILAAVPFVIRAAVDSFYILHVAPRCRIRKCLKNKVQGVHGVDIASVLSGQVRFASGLLPTGGEE